jgi:hypothetical protein
MLSRATSSAASCGRPTPADRARSGHLRRWPVQPRHAARPSFSPVGSSFRLRSPRRRRIAERQRLSRSRQQFEGIDPSAAREALELYTALQDPTTSCSSTELSQALQAQGLSPAQAEAEAARSWSRQAESRGEAVSDTLAH